MDNSHDNLWDGPYKIPWDDPDFSARMLTEHLAQEHDLASRRTEFIDKQVKWIHEKLLTGQPARILDLGCGPGLYAHRLLQRAHTVKGIDFAPASIAYAREHSPNADHGHFTQADLRDGNFGKGFDLAMILYGELNVFSPTECTQILRSARSALTDHGRLLLELHTPEAVRQMGLAQPTSFHVDAGLFSPHPHAWQQTSHWLPEQQTAVQTFDITEDTTGKTWQYRSTTKAYDDKEMRQLLREAGFDEIRIREDWPNNTEILILWEAQAD